MDDLLKSVRDRIGCMTFREREGVGPHMKAVNHPNCDDCLRLVLVCSQAEAPSAIQELTAAIRDFTDKYFSGEHWNNLGPELRTFNDLLIKYDPDACEQCHGKRGGTPGNENRVNGKILCDSCTAETRK